MELALPELAALAALAACAFLIMLHYAYGYSLGAFLTALAELFRHLGFKIKYVGRIDLGFIGDAIDGLNNAILHAIGAGIDATRGGWNYMLHYSAYTLERLGATLGDLADDTLEAFRHLVAVKVPAMIAIAVAPLVRRIAALEAIVATLPHKAEVVVRRPVEVVQGRVRVIEHKLVNTTLPRLRAIEREIDRLGKLERYLPRYLTRAGLVALIGATIFKAYGLGWLRCRGVQNLGRRLCGLSGWLEEALAVGIDAFVVLDLCRVVTLMTKGAEEAAPAFELIVGMTEDLLKCQKATRPAPLALTTYAGPPAIAPLELAA
jgi:hypothetical protein